MPAGDFTLKNNDTTAVGTLKYWDTGDAKLTPLCVIVDGTGAIIAAANGLHVQPAAGVTFAISAAALPLPTGAATAAAQATQLQEATFTGRVGEVQANPTANTVLARLKDLLTGIVLAAGTNNIGDVDVASIVPGSGATNLGKAEDAVHASGDIGVFMLGVRKDAATQLADTDGDYCGFIFDASGRLHVNVGNTVTVTGTVTVTQATAANLNMTEANSAAIAASCSVLDDWDETNRCAVNLISGQAGVAGGSGATDATTQRVVLATNTTVPNCSGDVAHDTADSGNPIKIGGVARQSNPAAVADGDRVNTFHDDVGRQVMTLGQARDLITDSGTITISSTTETDVFAAGGAGVFLDVTMVLVINTSASAVRVDFRDAAAGTVRFPVYVPAGETRGFIPPRPVKQTTANNKWTAQLASAVTDVRIFAQAEKNV